MKLVAVLVVAMTAVAGAEPPTEAEQLYNQGQAAYDAKRYDDALSAWERSYHLSHLPAMLFNVAQAHRLRAHAGDCTMAIEAYRNFVSLDPSSPQRATAEGFIVELGPCVQAEAQAVTSPPPASTTTHDERGGGKRLASYAVAGGSLVVIAIGAYFGGQASSLGKEVTAACARTCSFDEIAAKDAEGRGDVTKQYVFLGIGGAGLVASGVLYYLGSRETKSGVAVAPHGNGAMVTWSRAW